MPKDCQYQGYEFGATYLDSVCVKGVLYDADNCDRNGNMKNPLEEIPCPICHPRLAVIYHGRGEWTPDAKAIVDDIRRKCNLKTGERRLDARGNPLR